MSVQPLQPFERTFFASTRDLTPQRQREIQTLFLELNCRKQGTISYCQISDDSFFGSIDLFCDLLKHRQITKLSIFILHRLSVAYVIAAIAFAIFTPLTPWIAATLTSSLAALLLPIFLQYKKVVIGQEDNHINAKEELWQRFSSGIDLIDDNTLRGISQFYSLPSHLITESFHSVDGLSNVYFQQATQYRCNHFVRNFIPYCGKTTVESAFQNRPEICALFDQIFSDSQNLYDDPMNLNEVEYYASLPTRTNHEFERRQIVFITSINEFLVGGQRNNTATPPPETVNAVKRSGYSKTDTFDNNKENDDDDDSAMLDPVNYRTIPKDEIGSNKTLLIKNHVFLTTSILGTLLASSAPEELHSPLTNERFSLSDRVAIIAHCRDFLEIDEAAFDDILKPKQFPGHLTEGDHSNASMNYRIMRLRQLELSPAATEWLATQPPTDNILMPVTTWPSRYDIHNLH